jgi:hypothetical protein
MVTITLIAGAILTLAGVVGYVASGSESFTALIPSVIGVLLLLCGLVAKKEKFRRHAIHAALALALLGALGSLMNVLQIGELLAGTAERPSAVIVSTVMFGVLVVYLVFGIRSFITARRARAEQPGVS